MLRVRSEHFRSPTPSSPLLKLTSLTLNSVVMRNGLGSPRCTAAQHVSTYLDPLKLKKSLSISWQTMVVMLRERQLLFCQFVNGRLKEVMKERVALFQLDKNILKHINSCRNVWQTPERRVGKGFDVVIIDGHSVSILMIYFNVSDIKTPVTVIA